MAVHEPEGIYTGIAASPGIAIGKAFVVSRSAVQVPVRRIAADAADAEVERLKQAIAVARADLQKARARVEHMQVKEPRYILDVHLLILDDDALIRDSEERIRNRLVNAEFALNRTLKRFKRALSDVGDEYFRERATDIEQVGERILKVLLGEQKIDWHVSARGHVVLAHDLSPADTARLRSDQVLAFATDLGGRTSHTAIMARSLEIPAVVGLEHVTAHVTHGQQVILDGGAGIVIVDPTPEQVDDYQRRKTVWLAQEAQLLKESTLPATTLDGLSLSVSANIDLVMEADLVPAVGADGIGMFRTEYLFMNRTDLPSEEEQFQSYRDVVCAVAPKPTTIRTLDVGADKLASPVDVEVEGEMNPALGLRAIRYGLQEPDVLREQFRAILRASAFGPTRVMIPMISGLSEVLAAKELFLQAQNELEASQVPFDSAVQFGIMIEVPAAVLIADQLAPEVDFLSIGTNDLIQYALAIDRVNEHVAYLYEPLHPSILRLIQMVIDAGKAAGRPVNMCGEMAGETDYLLVLVGLGLRQLSMTTRSIPRVKRFLRMMDTQHAQEVAREAMSFRTAKEVREYVEQQMSDFEASIVLE